jgi:hypothetical protein
MKQICNYFTVFALALIYPMHYTLPAEYNGWAERTFSEMNLDEKIGQLFIVTSISDGDIDRKSVV